MPKCETELGCAVVDAVFAKVILVTVSGGVANVVEETIPEHYTVEIVDHDNLETAGSKDAQYLSKVAKRFYKAWR